MAKIGKDWVLKRSFKHEGDSRWGPSSWSSFFSLIMLCFFVALGLAIQALSPEPRDLHDNPMTYAKVRAMEIVFNEWPIEECKQKAIESLNEPYRWLAQQGLIYYPFSTKATKCVEKKMNAMGLGSLDEILKSNRPQTALLLDVNCPSAMDNKTLCKPIMLYAENQGDRVGHWLVNFFKEHEKRSTVQ